MSPPDKLITVWPCDHGGVEVERIAVPLGLTCAQCGAHPAHYVPLDALLSDEAIEAMVLAAATPVHDDGHTDTYYHGLMQAAITAVLSREQKP